MSMYANANGPRSANPRTSSSSNSSNHSGQWNWQNTNGQTSPSDVSASVHKLLLSTKHLQEALRLWSIEQMNETEVSDVYVQLGADFNAAVRAFAYHDIDLSDILNFTQVLREVLEGCLSEDPSPETLANFTPALRQALYHLLKGLQMRESAWKAAISR
ncbi:hypothetical protein HGRIS_004571 [Hohenbuehelia grisea]|uniref:Aip3p/Bud6 N-terminal domain-containing protein n=1 Tax=Hohenbuehelia grisea TaxID=104357 RepID=A0ABR3JC96_9AGAR